MLKLIMFDWDGTCHDSMSKIRHCYEYSVGKLNWKADWDSMRPYLGQPFVKFAHYACPNHPEEYVKYYLEEYFRLPEAPLYKGTIETIEILKKDFNVCLVTGKPRKATADCLRNVGMSDVFDYMVCAEDTENSKPSPEPLLKAVEYYNVLPKEAVYIGDAVNDFKASKAAGTNVIGVTWGALHREETEKQNPDFIAETWQDVIQICNKLK